MLIAAAVVVVILLSLGVYVWLKVWPERGDVPLLKTVAWEFRALNEFEGERLMLRRETGAGGALLLKHTDLKTVYWYDLRTRALNEIGEAEWEKARGSVGHCGAQQTGATSVLRRDDRQHKLFAGEREIPTAGGIPLDELRSPSGKWIAVHSAAGPAVASILPFSPDLALGQRYHEIMSVPDIVRVGKPVRIPVDVYYTYLHPCWSSDEKFVIYTDHGSRFLVVVETGL